MTYYLGHAGSLIALPDPESGLVTAHERIGGTHQLLSGAKVRDTLGYSRSWQMSWTAIDPPTYSTLLGFYYGTPGPGPYYLIDPEQRNLLSPDVSSAGDASNSVSAFVQQPNVTATRTTLAISQPWQTGTIQLALGTALTAGQETLEAPGVPVVPGLTYTASASFNIAAGSVGHYIRIRWVDATGTALSTTAGSVVAANSTGTSVASGAAPSNAAYASVASISATANTSGSVLYVYTSMWQLEQSSVASSWVPGSGSQLVTVDSLTRTNPIAGICDAQMTLVQVG